MQYEEGSARGALLKIEGYRSLEYLDYPALPFRVVGILLPQGEEVVSYRLEIQDEIMVAPRRPLALHEGSERDDGTSAGIVLAKSAAETEDGIFPRWRARHTGSSDYRGYHIANFAVYPVRYDVATGGLVVCTEARLVVETAPASSAVVGAKRVRHVDGFREKSRSDLETMVVNPEEAAGYVWSDIEVNPGTRGFVPSYEPSMQGSEVAYLIVTNEAMASTFQKLADAKTKKGVPAVVRTTEWISENYRAGADLAESIRIFIREAYEKWGVEWVLLGGDTEVIPARFGFVAFYTGDFIPTDMYYSCLDGSWNADADSLWGEAYHSSTDTGDDCDLYAEVYLGRLPASNAAEAGVLVNKTINYAIPIDAGSKSKFLMLAEVVFPSDYHPGDAIILDGAEISQAVYTSHLNGNPDVTTARLYENYTAYPGSTQLLRTLSIDSMNAGTGHILHVGHGYKYNMSVGDGSILNYDANSLTNGNKIFAMYLMNCTNVAFDTDCLAEYFLLNPNGGALSVTGASRSAFPSASRPYLDTYYHMLFDQDITQLGKLHALSREPYTSSAFGETADRWTHFIYNLLGDPETCLFQGRARTFAVVKPASALFGPNDIQIQVTSGGAPYDSAFVCLYKKGDDYRYAPTGPTGAVTFDDFLCKSSGPIYVTVTGLNHGRYLDSIMVASQTPAYLRVNATMIEDFVVGNNDRRIDAGETAHFHIELKNTGMTAATKLYGAIRSQDPEVIVIDSTSVYPNISAGGKGTSVDGFRFAVSPTMPDEDPIEFTVEVRDSTGRFWSEKLALEVHAPALALYVNTMTDTLPYGNNNGIIEAGENFLLAVGIKNFGTGTAYGLSAKIRSLDSDLIVTDSTSVYGDIALLGTEYGSGFVLREVNIAQVNQFSLTVTDAYGRTLSRTMELRRPAAPTTLVLNASYGATEIQLTWHRPDSAESYRYRVYHSLDSGGPYTAVNRDLISYTLFRDTDLLPSTRYYYVVTTVDSCGNEGPPCAEKTATTSPPQLLGWPNRLGKETASSVKIADVDGDRHPDIVVGADYIYAWNANGIELRDGDGQPLTWGVFNTLGSNYTATVALGDLDGVLGFEIVGSSWNTRQIYVFNKNGATLPGWPKTVKYQCWASPVLADLDGDGDLEIVAYDISGIVYAWHHNGVEVRDGDLNPTTDGYFFVTKNPNTWHLSTPGFADMDEDGIGELIVCAPGDSIYCLNGNGSRVPGWPVPLADVGANITASPAIGDIDGDGHLEMIVPSSAGRVYGLNHNGTMMTGWPQWIYCNANTIVPSPALADLDDDGRLEIVIAGLDKKCYILRHDGTAFPHWPQVYTTAGTSESSPIIADIDGDRSLDIILGCEEGRLNAWNLDGEYIAGFPILLGSFIRGTPMVHDIDLNGDLELAASCWDQNVYVWDLAGEWYNGCMQWNGFHANVYNNGLKDFLAPTDASGIACIFRLLDDGIELTWSVVPEALSWNLYRERSGAGFELIAARLHADETNMVNFIDATAEAGLSYRYRLEADGRADLVRTTEEIMVPVRDARLYQNHPNPFNPSTTIPFAIPGGAETRRNALLAVYDIRGSLVKALVQGALSGGRHEAVWDGRNDRGESVASGIYFVQLSTGGYQASRKLILLR